MSKAKDFDLKFILILEMRQLVILPTEARLTLSNLRKSRISLPRNAKNISAFSPVGIIPIQSKGEVVTVIKDKESYEGILIESHRDSITIATEDVHLTIVRPDLYHLKANLIWSLPEIGGVKVQACIPDISWKPYYTLILSEDHTIQSLTCSAHIINTSTPLTVDEIIFKVDSSEFTYTKLTTLHSVRLLPLWTLTKIEGERKYFFNHDDVYYGYALSAKGSFFPPGSLTVYSGSHTIAETKFQGVHNEEAIMIIGKTSEITVLQEVVRSGGSSKLDFEINSKKDHPVKLILNIPGVKAHTYELDINPGENNFSCTIT